MALNTKIEYVDASWDPWRGCTEVSPGCANCYARELSYRNPAVFGSWGKGKPRVKSKGWGQPILWDRKAAQAGEPLWVFPSKCDWLDEEVPAEWLGQFLDLISATPHLKWLLLSKRPQNFVPRLQMAADWLDKASSDGYTPVCGTSSKRNHSLPIREIRGTGDRRGGSDLAREEANIQPLDGRSEDGAVRASSGGDGKRERLSSGADNARQEADIRRSASSGVDALQRADSARNDYKPQTRTEGGQPAVGVGVGDIQRAATSRDKNAWSASSRREGSETSKDESKGRGCSDDAATSSGRRDGEEYSSALRHEAESCRSHSSPSDVDPSSVAQWIRAWLNGQPPANVWVGTSVEDQTRADERIPILLATPAALRFLSVEPLLESVNLGRFEPLNVSRIGWIIVGGESRQKSGPARHCHTEWIRRIVFDCALAKIPVFVKQMGSNTWTGNPVTHPKGGDPSEWPSDLRVRQFPEERR